ncbi:MAG: cytochrome C [Acidimicrobiia bacterium]|nr:cytochrome C [Acidimicrobiia bacterium]
MQQTGWLTGFAVVLAVSIGLVGRAQGPRGQQVALPEGEGKALVEAACAQCHGLNLVANSYGHTAEGWRTTFASMVALPTAQAATVASYLATHFPPKPAPEPVLLNGPAKISIREWLVPTLGSRPHDPLAAADGSIWWTGQFASTLGRVDPKTGTMREYALPDASGPHGLVEDRSGHVWYTGISKNYIGSLDPASGTVKEYPLPEDVRGPHTPIFDQAGTLWFTLQSGHVGRLVPSTGEITVKGTPSAGTYPYGIAVNSKGVPWYVDFRGNRLGHVDPATMTITEHTLPHADARPRRIAISPDDAVWYTDYTRGYLGRFDPATGQAREWRSPGGATSQPYGIAAARGAIWYSESGVRPNTLVRFDPSTESFQTWTIPSGGGVVRHMMATASGNLVLACSGVNRVALVEISG